MTRKRFIKLLMSKGVQRNQAAQIAKEVREYGVVGLSYKAASNGKIVGIGRNVKYALNLSIDDFADFSVRRNRYGAKKGIIYHEEYLKNRAATGLIVEKFNPYVDNEEDYKTKCYWLRSPCSENAFTTVSVIGVKPGLGVVSGFCV